MTPPEETEGARPSRQRVVVGLALLFALIGVLVVALDWREIVRVFREANWRLIPAALLFTALSYLCMSYGFAVVNRAVGIRMRRRDLIEIGFVSTVINHVLSAGGAAGYSLRIPAIQRQGYAVNDIVAASVLHFYFTSLGMLALLPLGVGFIYFDHRLSQGATIGVGLATLALMALFLLATLVVFWRPLRLRILAAASSAVQSIAQRDMAPALDEFDVNIQRGVAALRSQPSQFAWLIVLVMLDWSFSIAALWACFDALGDPLHPGVLVAGFALGITAGVLSMIPGGLGVQEGSMAGIYALLGVPFQQAVLATILFRVVYYFAPYLFSLSLYRRLLRQVQGAAPPEANSKPS